MRYTTQMTFHGNISMQVEKRDGRREEVSFDKVLERIRRASDGLAVNPTAIAQKILAQIYDGVKTSELDELTSQLAASLATVHPDYGALAARITISNHQKNTEPSFAKVVQELANQKAPKTGEKVSYINEALLRVVRSHGTEIDAYMQHDRDYLLDYFGFKTLERAYLLKDTAGRVLERPQHMWMRVALGLWSDNLERAFETYDLMSQKYFTHATPTLFNAGTKHQQLSSCYLIAMDSDSIHGIYKTLGDCAQISKYAGGIGMHCHNIRAKGSIIRGTNGTSNGLVPMLRVFNNTARYVDQCFTPDTLVYTLAGPKAIEDIGVTDKVLTSTGNYENVKLPVRHEYSGRILEIQVKNAVYPVRVTPEHQIYALKGQNKGVNFDVITNRLEKNISKPEFYDADELQKGDFLVFPIPKFEQDHPNISEEDCRIYGILLGDGYVGRDTVAVYLNTTTKEDTAKFVCNYLESRGIKYHTELEGNVGLRIRWSPNSPGFKFTRSQLYDENKQKRVDPVFLHLPLNKIKQVVRGIIETDGCVGTKEIAVELSSYPLIEALRYMMLRLGSLSSGYERNRVGHESKNGEIITRLPTAVLRIPRIPEIMEMFPNAPKGEFFSYLRYGDNLFTRVQEITETNYEGVVHDFEIEGPHDYTVAHLGVAHNGGGRRNGSFAIYLEPWHADVEDFLRLKLNNGSEEERARDLFYAMWISDLFMKRVEEDGDWTLFCPSEAPGLADVHSAEFEELYTRYEREGRGRKTIKAQKLWFQILDTQMETGTPYLLYKDPANAKSNQQNLGTIKSSNLCVAPETLILTDKGYIKIEDLAGQEVNVWNGRKWSKTTVLKTGENQDILGVDVLDAVLQDDGSYTFNMKHIECTPYHKFILESDDSLAKSERVDAKDLKRGMVLHEWVDSDGVVHEPIVWGVYQYGRKSDTYCFNEPENHAGIFNGILTGNCTEILEYSDSSETAVCNLASIGLPAFVDQTTQTFDFVKLREVVKVATRNLNRVIDINYYPTPETRKSNMRHRPIGLGVQGLADVFAMMRLPWDSEGAADLNQRIFEHIYYASMEESMRIAHFEEGPYETFQGSPASKGQLQPDLWSVKPLTEQDGTLSWKMLKENVVKYGIRNSLLVAPMPTASTSQIMSYNECITGDALISLPNGISKQLKDFSNNKSYVTAYDEINRGSVTSEQYEFIPKGIKNIIELTMFDGRTLKCTDNHKIILKDGTWKMAKDININDELIMTVIGTEDKKYEDEMNWNLNIDTYKFTMDNNDERQRTLAFARILGYIRTDGSIQASGKITAVFGGKTDVADFLRDCNVVFPTENNYKINKTSEYNCYQVTITGDLRKAIVNTPGMPIGTRVSQKCTWPDFIMDETCPKAVLREFIAGLFGGDGMAPCLIKNGKHYVFSRICFSQTACPANKDNLINMMNDLCKLLSKLNISNSAICNIRNVKSTKHNQYRCGDDYHVSVKINLPAGYSTFNTFMKNIGIRYCTHKMYRFEIAASWSRYICNIYNQYTTILNEAYNKSLNYKGKGRYVKALEDTNNEYSKSTYLLDDKYSKPSIELFYSYIRNKKKSSDTEYNISRIRFDTIIDAAEYLNMTNTKNMFNDPTANNKNKKVVYATDRESNIMPIYNMKVMSKINKGEEEVYDINVSEHHTFIANGIVVHNCFEPFTSNLYTRRTLAGEYIIVNKYLLKDLIDRGLWNEDMKQMIIARNGSIQGIVGIPDDLQDLYKTAWELKQRTLIDLAAARGAFICQSQSLNLFVADPSYAKLTSMHFYAWKKGLKTGCYYLRTKAAVMAQKFTVDPKFLSTMAIQASSPSKPISEPTQSLTRSETRAERLERLAREYEEEQQKANEAAASGEGCLMCSG